MAALLSLTLCSCKMEGLSDTPGKGWDPYEDDAAGEMMILGKQLSNPYSVDNMTNALGSLYPTKADGGVNATDLYVRFLPATQDEYDLLDSLGVQMIDHPVDYEIVRDGDYYHDPSVPEGSITWQYAVVPTDFEFPSGIKHEILEHCYITEHRVVTRAGEGIDWEEVEREAFRISGNGDMIPSGGTKASAAAEPSGRITLVDSRYPDTPEGVKGVRVACNVFVKIGQAYTDSEGYYQIGKSFSSKPRYWLVFKNRKGYGIGLNLILVGGSSSSLGKHSQEGYDAEITRDSGKTLFSRCVVNNAVWDYMEQCGNSNASMKAPPSNLRLWIFNKLNSSSTIMMQHGAGVDNTIIGKYLGDYAVIAKWFLPDITIGTKGKDDYASIYSATVHELAHASHYQQVGKGYWDKFIAFILSSFVSSGFVTYGTGGEEDAGICEVSEMWAYYMETKLYRERYPDSQAIFGTSWWFYPQIFLYLDDRGLSRYQISKALPEGVTDRDLLREKLLVLYPEFKTNILLAFNRYYR